MSRTKRMVFSFMSMICFVVILAATVYAASPDNYNPYPSKDWLIGVLVAFVAFLGGLGVNEMLRRLSRLEKGVSRTSLHTQLIAQHIGLKLPEEE